MKNKHRVFAALLALVLCAAFMSLLVFADPEDTTQPTAQETAAPTETPVEAPVETVLPTEPETEAPTEAPVEEAVESTPQTGETRSMFQFTPDGNLTLIDDFNYVGMDADGKVMSKQFITVQSRDGSYFYIIIDRTGDAENVYFLNQVNLADLRSLANNETQTIPDFGCTCTSVCMVGHIDMSCPVCSTDMTACAAVDPDADDHPSSTSTKPADTTEKTDPITDDPQEEKNSIKPILSLVLIVVILGGVFFFVFKDRLKGGKGGGKLRRRKPELPEYDFDDDDDELEAEPAPDERPSEEQPEEPEEAFEDDDDLM